MFPAFLMNFSELLFDKRRGMTYNKKAGKALDK